MLLVVDVMVIAGLGKLRVVAIITAAEWTIVWPLFQVATFRNQEAMENVMVPIVFFVRFSAMINEYILSISVI